MPSPGENVLLVKLPRVLAARLREHAEAWGRCYAKGQKAPAPADGSVPYPLPYIIEVLLTRDAKKRVRGRRKPKPAPYQG